jgi:hypothetical protein
MILKDSLFRIHKNFKTIKNVMIISTLVNDIRSEDHVCLSPLSVQKTQIPASQKLLKMPVE